MDKNKNRTDLLAAGRKKLQQYRQKKDNKGGSSHGKSSKKSSKSEQQESDADKASTVSNSSKLPESSGKGIVSLSASDLGTLDAKSDDLVAIDPSSVSLASEPGGGVTALSDSVNVDMQDQDPDSNRDSSNPIEGKNLGAIDDEMKNLTQFGTSDIPDSEGETKRDGNITGIDMLPPAAIAGHTDGMNTAVEIERVNGAEVKELLPSRADAPVPSLIPGRGDQVTDVGAMQGTDGLGPEEFGAACYTEHEGIPKLALSEQHQVSEYAGQLAPEQIGAVEAVSQSDQDDVLPSASETNRSEGSLASALVTAPTDVAIISEVRSQQDHLYNEDPRDIEQIEMISGLNKDGGECSQSGTIVAEASSQYLPDEPFVFVDKIHERSPGDTSPINFSQLIEVLRGLSEEEFRLLLKSRGLASDGDSGSSSQISPHHALQGFLERISEELFLVSCTKDILSLQLSELSNTLIENDHQFHHLGHEVSVLRASFQEACERSDYISKELAESKSELQATLLEREELQHQFHEAKAEIEVVSSRANELQNRLEKSQSEFLSLSKESTECKDVVAALQLEIEGLNGTVASLTEEKSLSAHENEKLLRELADCKNLLGTLQEENANLTTTLASVTEERKNLESEKESLATSNEKVSVELTDCKTMLEAQQIENRNLNAELALVIEERKKFGEDKRFAIHENERLSSELLALHERSAEYHEERIRFESELKEVKMRLEQLMEENMLLSSSVDMYKAKVREIDTAQPQLSSQIAEAVNEVGSLKAQSRDCENVADFEHSHEISVKQAGEAPLLVLEKSVSGGLPGGRPTELSKLEAFDDSFRFTVLNAHLEEADRILQHIEKAVEDIHSSILNRPGSKAPAAAVSKLIQAFESKVHADESEVEDRPITEDQSLVADLFGSTKDHTKDLKAVLQQLVQDVAKAGTLCRLQHDGANDEIRELKGQVEALKEYSDNLEPSKIELDILDEALKQHVSGVKENNSQLQVLYETLKQQCSSLELENFELGKKLNEAVLAMDELQSQLHNSQKNSDEMASMHHDQLEKLQQEANERALTTQQGWNSTTASTVEVIQRLDDFIGFSYTSNISDSTPWSLDISSRVASSVDAAIKMIDVMKEKIEAAAREHEADSNSFNILSEKYSELLRKNELTMNTMTRLYSELKELVADSGNLLELSDISRPEDELFDGLDYSRYRSLIELLKNFLAERLELHSANSKLTLELMNRTNEVEELSLRCVDSSFLQKLLQEVEDVVNPEDAGIELDGTPASCLESLVFLLVHKYKHAGEQFSSLKEELGYKVTELTGLQETMHQLTALKLQHESEIQLLKEHLSQADEALLATRSELQGKVNEVEQSEQRVSSLREKLSIAVAKGKGLVVQRDNLKQSLAETASELERCSQELQLKDARLHEIETKLKIYSEAGERMESLESELSYIRNSATALRESFLLKDSLIQRIEEILEDLDLPEHFHSRDIIEKVDWLARSVTGNSLPLTEMDQRVSVEGSYSDAGFVAMDARNEDIPRSPDSIDELRREYEELQGRFYGLAEQNEMLEQSLLERNHLVQRWEELLDRIDMPSHLRSVEPEDKIEWLGSALSEANHDRNSLLQKIDKLENYCASVTADLEESQKRISFLDTELESSRKRITDVEMNLQAVISERDNASERLEALTCDREQLLAKSLQFELDNETLLKEVSSLQEEMAKKLENEGSMQIIHGEISRLHGLVCDALQDPGAKDMVSGVCNTETLEGVLRKLIENYMLLSSVKPVVMNAAEEHHAKLSDADLIDERSRDTLDTGNADITVLEREVKDEPDVGALKQELEATLSELTHVRDERDIFFEKQQSLIFEVEALNKKVVEFKELLAQEEQKSNSVREKLNVAVRKGKSLVQLRDGLKQTIEEMNTELERLKSEIKQRDSALMDYEQKMKDLTIHSERGHALESECLFLRSRMAETEYHLQEKGHTLTLILNALGNIEVGGDIGNIDPLAKLEYIAKTCHDLRAALASAEQESRKSGRAAELLLAELNEVQERNDGLQEELAKASIALTEISKERDMAEAAKLEAFSHLEKVSEVNSELSMKQSSELMVLKSATNELRKSFFDINNSVAHFFSKELEFLKGLEAGVESCFSSVRNEGNHMVPVPLFSAADGITFRSSEKESLLSLDSLPETYLSDNSNGSIIFEVCTSVQELRKEARSMKAMLSEHSMTLHQQASNLSKLIGTFYGEVTSQNQSFEALKKEFKRIESAEMEATVLRRNIALLYEACTNSLMEIENGVAETARDTLTSGAEGLKLKPELLAKTGQYFGGDSSLLSEEHIKTLAERLLTVVKDFACFKGEVTEGKEKEMKFTISSLQKELQDKDMQRERICMDLVSQVKKAEAAATSYSLDLQSARSQMNDLEKQLQMVNEERNMLEQSVKNLREGQIISTELQEKLRSMTRLLTAKDQEIEALMQAIEEEEIQMEDLTNKITELEKVVQQKNTDIENLEASRGKVMKKLSITVSKFDELHHFSETLLAEVEKLQAQLQDRDAEISFLRQEVTRCTNDVLAASQMSSKRNSDEINDLLMWLDISMSEFGMQDGNLADSSLVQGHKELLQRKVTCILSKVGDLQVVANSRDELLQMERGKVEELTRKVEILEKSLHEKEVQLNMLEDGHLGEPANTTPEILEVEPVINKWTVTGPSAASQVRSLRKVNNEQVAIAIDDETGGSSRLEDEDDDKIHGFRSLTTSRIIPKFTRPVTDMIDGLWVSCDRTLMRQPTLRLGIIIYWAILHTLLATFVV